MATMALTSRVSAIVVPCSARKGFAADSKVNWANGASKQSQLETAWIARVKSLSRSTTPGQFYCGRGATSTRDVAASLGANWLVASAGLGLVAEHDRIPAYDLTVSPAQPGHIGRLIAEPFDPSAWWLALQRLPTARRLAELFADSRKGLVLIALTQPYARMLGQALGSLAPKHLARVRIFGKSLDPAWLGSAADVVMPYDDRLDALAPGVKGEFAHRALCHFAGLVSEREALDLESNKQTVRRCLRGKAHPEPVDRRRCTDDELLRLIRQYRSLGSASKVLRALRDEEQVACSQARCHLLCEEALVGA